MNRWLALAGAFCWMAVATIGCAGPAVAAERGSPVGEPAAQGAESLSEVLRRLPADVFPQGQRAGLQDVVPDDLARRLRAANDRSRLAWQDIKDRQQWEQFRDPRLEALRRSLGHFPDPPPLAARVTGRIDGDGWRIENLVFQSRPGLWVTANLYLPARPAGPTPGILICHSHHTPKEHGELQDMGVTWSRSGCAVLVMDQLGHGERRQHPFNAAEDYAGPFPVSRQDYYFRYDAGIQLHLVGESLAGWMAWDLMRGVDLLLSRPGIDPKRIMLLGAVAGGGDPAAVAACLDRRIAAAVPFNFGGPQPETAYPLAEDAETSFNYAGSGSWESTRNLRRSAADGFLPWVIVGGIAPRRLVYAHEFSWDRQRDPVWKRLEEIYAFYGVADNLAYTHGRGQLRGQAPEATHCTHIGRPHRAMIDAAFERWFGIRVDTAANAAGPLDGERLLCMTPEAQRELKPAKLHQLLRALAAERTEAARRRMAALPPDQRRSQLRESWSRVLGNVEVAGQPRQTAAAERERLAGGVIVFRIVLRAEPGIPIPLLLLVPDRPGKTPAPVVVAVSQSGKAGLLHQRAGELAELLDAGIAVCLPDVRGTGETRAGEDRGCFGTDTALSSTELMLGGTMVGSRLRDLRTVLAWLRGSSDVDARRIALWGDSPASVNPPATDFRVPHRVDGRPASPEPLGGLLALLGALFEEDVCGVYVAGGLGSFESVLDGPFVLIPHDAVVPGVLAAGDLPDVAAALAPRPLRLDGLVDGRNRHLPPDQVRSVYRSAEAAYRDAGREDRLSIAGTGGSPAEWLIDQIGDRRAPSP